LSIHNINNFRFRHEYTFSGPKEIKEEDFAPMGHLKLDKTVSLVLLCISIAPEMLVLFLNKYNNIIRNLILLVHKNSVVLYIIGI
jgi:hypothetical protein